MEEHAKELDSQKAAELLSASLLVEELKERNQLLELKTADSPQLPPSIEVNLREIASLKKQLEAFKAWELEQAKLNLEREDETNQRFQELQDRAAEERRKCRHLEERLESKEEEFVALKREAENFKAWELERANESLRREEEEKGVTYVSNADSFNVSHEVEEEEVERASGGGEVKEEKEGEGESVSLAEFYERLVKGQQDLIREELELHQKGEACYTRLLQMAEAARDVQRYIASKEEELAQVRQSLKETKERLEKEIEEKEDQIREKELRLKMKMVMEMTAEESVVAPAILVTEAEQEEEEEGAEAMEKGGEEEPVGEEEGKTASKDEGGTILRKLLRKLRKKKQTIAMLKEKLQLMQRERLGAAQTTTPTTTTTTTQVTEPVRDTQAESARALEKQEEKEEKSAVVPEVREKQGENARVTLSEEFRGKASRSIDGLASKLLVVRNVVVDQDQSLPLLEQIGTDLAELHRTMSSPAAAFEELQIAFLGLCQMVGDLCTLFLIEDNRLMVEVESGAVDSLTTDLVITAEKKLDEMINRLELFFPLDEGEELKENEKQRSPRPAMATTTKKEEKEKTATPTKREQGGPDASLPTPNEGGWLGKISGELDASEENINMVVMDLLLSKYLELNEDGL